MSGSKKRKSVNITKDPCDELEWLVDVFGTMELVEGILSLYDEENFVVVDVKKKRQVPANGDMEYLKYKPNTRDIKQGIGKKGLYFDGSHWYSLKNGVTKDSYMMKYQQSGTAHFCQTFAILIYTGLSNTKYKLYPNELGRNIYTAIQFWIDLISDNSSYAKFIIDEIKNWVDEDNKSRNSSNIYLYDKPINKITKASLIKFLRFLQNMALNNVYNGCKQG